MDQLASTMLPLGDYQKRSGRSPTKTELGQRQPSGQPGFMLYSARANDTIVSVQLSGGTTQPIIHTVTGEQLAEHRGTHNYTIGQRKGLAIAYSEPLYVTSLNSDLSVVYVGPKEALLRRELTASCTNWLMTKKPDAPFEALAKIRYNSPACPAVVTPLEDDRVQVTFVDAQPADNTWSGSRRIRRKQRLLLGGA